MDVGAVLNSLKIGVDALKQAREISEKWDNVQIRQLLLVSMEEMLKAREGALDLKQEIIDLKAENQKLQLEVTKKEDATAFKASLIPKDNVYYQMDGSNVKAAFCPVCMDKSNLAIRLKHEGGAQERVSQAWRCPSCGFYNW